MYVHGTDLSWDLVSSWDTLPASLTLFSAYDCPNFIGTPNFSTISNGTEQIDISGTTGAESGVNFDGMSSTLELTMEKSVKCSDSFCNFNTSDPECTLPAARSSDVCQGITDCKDSCNCRGCFDPTAAPTTLMPTLEPTERPTIQPNANDGTPTEMPITPAPTIRYVFLFCVFDYYGVLPNKNTKNKIKTPTQCICQFKHCRKRWINRFFL